MTFEITRKQLVELIPNNRHPDVWLELLNETLPKYHINTLNRVALFMAQVIHESAQFTRLEENLNYRPDRLLSVWPGRFSRVTAELARNKPDVIANIVYCDRMGNGDFASGDGYKYRGRGLIQLTGFNNYKSMAEILGITVDQLVNTCSTPTTALVTACAFWEKNGCNELADKKMLTRISRIINGGDNGLTERKVLFNQCLKVLGTKG